MSGAVCETSARIAPIHALLHIHIHIRMHTRTLILTRRA